MSDSTLGCGCLSIITLVVLAVAAGLIGGPPWLYIIVAVVLLTVYVQGYRNGGFEQANGQTSAQATQTNTQSNQQYVAQREAEAAELERLIAIEEQNRQKALSAALRHSELMEEIGRLSGTEFEAFVAEFLEAQGYAVQTTMASGDQGVDLLASVPNEESAIAIQIKRYSRPLGNKPVQEAFAGMVHYKAQEAWVITNSSFTPGAHELASSTGVKLIGGDELGTWFEEVADALEPEPNAEGDQQLASEIAEERGEEHPGESVGTQHVPSVAEQIRELGSLRDDGLITDEDFEEKKRQLLGRM